MNTWTGKVDKTTKNADGKTIKLEYSVTNGTDTKYFVEPLVSVFPNPAETIKRIVLNTVDFYNSQEEQASLLDDFDENEFLGDVTAPTPETPIDPRAGIWVVISTFDPNDPGTEKTTFDATEDIGVNFALKTPTPSGSIVPLSQEFSTPILKFDRYGSAVGEATVLKTTLVNGQGSLIISAGKLVPGYYGIDDTVSTVAHADKYVITVRGV